MDTSVHKSHFLYMALVMILLVVALLYYFGRTQSIAREVAERAIGVQRGQGTGSPR